MKSKIKEVKLDEDEEVFVGDLVVAAINRQTNWSEDFTGYGPGGV